jgi:hypothetical protein
MIILIYLVLLTTGGLLNYAIKPNIRVIYGVAVAFLCISMLLCADYWLYYFGGIRSAFIHNLLLFIQTPGELLGHLLTGYLLINILFALRDEDKVYPSQKITYMVLWGISILTANMFMIFTMGKAQHLCSMSSFFRASGYANWFLYFIMIAETLGALGILLHFKLKTGIVATTGLMLIMIGALYTHCHNRDPLPDSYDAVMQFITLALLQVGYYFEKRVAVVEEALPGVSMGVNA